MGDFTGRTWKLSEASSSMSSYGTIVNSVRKSEVLAGRYIAGDVALNYPLNQMGRRVDRGSSAQLVKLIEPEIDITNGMSNIVLKTHLDRWCIRQFSRVR
ncbi:MAG: hypothetical protein JXB42_13530 [Deltaproteobacteria bacterium]|nr:hypothetical protein [Deltaproteobacteria bacterium]